MCVHTHVCERDLFKKKKNMANIKFNIVIPSRRETRRQKRK